MRQRTFAAWMCASAGVMLLLATTLEAQFTPPPPAPAAKLPPLLYVRLAGPKGMKVTLYRGEAQGVRFDAPCVIGLRPGYRCQIELSNIPGFKGASFFPTLDVHGSLALIAQLRNADYPATILFTDDDFAKVEAGTLLRKTIILERPEDALPIAARADQPIELAVPPGRHLLQEASRHGAPLAVMTLGQRRFTREEMRDAALPGTLLLPGEKNLAVPRVPPCLPWACYSVSDPLLGPPHAGEWTTLHDGGDMNLPAGYGQGGRLAGLDPSDTIAEYVDPRGRKRIVPSNRVHVCVPRFILLRTEQTVGGHVATLAPGGTQSNQQGIAFTGRLTFAEEKTPLRLESTAGRLKPSATVNEEGTAVTGRVNGTEVAATLRAPDTLDGSHPPPRAGLPPLRPLRIIKWPSCAGANVGDIITFYLRFTNQGAEPITDVAVSDSLTPRFEYVAGSQRTDRAAGFTLQQNEAGSAVLRWEFAGALPAGASGTISFQVRVR